MLFAERTFFLEKKERRKRGEGLFFFPHVFGSLLFFPFLFILLSLFVSLIFFLTLPAACRR